MLECATETALRKALAYASGRNTALVVRGDALCDAATAALVAELGPGARQVHPGVGPVQAALARLGLPPDAAEVLDLQRDSVIDLRARLRRHRLLAIRLAGRAQSAEIGALLAQAGFHDAHCWLCDGFDDAPRVSALLVSELAAGEQPCDDDAVLVIATGDCAGYPEFPGLDCEPGVNALPAAVRLLALAWLQPAAGEAGWVIDDSDAALAIDWARSTPLCRVLAAGTEAADLARRAAVAGVGANLSAALPAGPADCAAWPVAEAVFLRGGAALPAWLQILWKRLPPGGRLVVSAEDEEARADLIAGAAQWPAQRWEELSCSRGETLAGRLRFAPAAPVRLALWQKPQA
ncbi:MAG: hypothetical protein HGA47_14150 [Zoogloea sp.]|nr:hypothetical protein [Zoogloea sp.]